MSFWYSLRSFGIFFTFWYVWTEKNLATLLLTAKSLSLPANVLNIFHTVGKGRWGPFNLVLGCPCKFIESVPAPSSSVVDLIGARCHLFPVPLINYNLRTGLPERGICNICNIYYNIIKCP
jgi:hypothetical protein